MRQRTKWLYKASYSNGQLLVGHLYNYRPRCDTVRLRWENDKEVLIDMGLRVDEAVDMAAGLTYLASLQMYDQKAKQQKRARKAARTRRREPPR